ncbi:HAMP domain-containing histidine kinase [Chitinophaga pendula]|uniref:sensor histidine kinase n=1 Tax=Chitinophaga TaxID=79328 RepID=UPI000BAEC9EB|nr:MULTISPECIES: HAMP domain-containing sensor histidine kinase [Chitinophaga]ASZ10732.1 two-component sensor histidine kinase [Chitinophaga sp. MD30]UCJ06291.1 HAMP domain-containing histidine kinase [Chitinophaga pendula]
MKIRNKLTSLFTLLFAVLLAVFALFIYLSAAQARKASFYKHLQQEAVTKANLLLDAKVPADVLHVIYRNAKGKGSQEEVAIYDTAFHLLYHDAVDIDKVKETREMIRRIAGGGPIAFEQAALQVTGFAYPHNGQLYVITAAATDVDGLRGVRYLLFSLVVGFLGIITLTWIAGRFFARKALQPVAEMVDKVEDITATRLDLRVPVQNEKDEIGELAVTFNHMLDRLEQSFTAQKQFVSNISHELRTPLAAMTGELELALQQVRSVATYEEVINLALLDARRMAKLSNGLLDLAKASFDPTAISKRSFRADELLLDARDQVLRSHSSYGVTIVFEQEIDDDDRISVNGNEYLLKVAFVNLMENSCKFSADHHGTVTIGYGGDELAISFTDEGIGITAEDLPYIFEPFFRGDNKRYAEGNGIGLSLTRRIITLHKGDIQVASRPGEGTTFTILLPHL